MRNWLRRPTWETRIESRHEFDALKRASAYGASEFSRAQTGGLLEWGWKRLKGGEIVVVFTVIGSPKRHDVAWWVEVGERIWHPM